MGLDVAHEGDVVVATWRDGENRLNLDTVAALEGLVGDGRAHAEGPCALVLTGEGKFFSNGLDLERFAGDAATSSPRPWRRFHALLGRLYVAPAYTVAAVNGHAFAGGAMLTCAFDHRVMREDRGYWCLNEAELGLPAHRARWRPRCSDGSPAPTALEAMLTARRYAGPDALAAGIVDELAAEDRVAATCHRARGGRGDEAPPCRRRRTSATRSARSPAPVAGTV